MSYMPLTKLGKTFPASQVENLQRVIAYASSYS